MTYLIVSTYDFNPSFLSYFKYWDELKKKHEKLQLSIGLVPVWKNKEINNVKYNNDFFDWYKVRKEWVHIIQQGCYNISPSECLRFEKTQQKFIKRGLKKIHKFMPKDIYGFVPPYFRMNNNTISVLRQLGYSFVVYHNQILFLKNPVKSIPAFDIIQTFTNLEEEKSNSINLIHDELDIQLTEYEKIKQYTSFNELAKKVLVRNG